MSHGTLSSILKALESHLDTLDESTPHSSVGILLWGAPGSGKTTIAKELANKYNPLYYINIDTIVEKLLYILSRADYQRLKNHTKSTAQENDFFYEERKISFRNVPMSAGELFRYLFENAVFINDQLHNVAPIQENEINDFMATNKDKHIASAFESFLIYLAKRRGQNFMKETTGNSLHERWIRETFSGVNSILQVIFVSSARTLEKRVRHREQMFNIDPKDIAPVYDKSYFYNLYTAIKMHIFKDISVTSNDTYEHKTLIKLTKHTSRRGYSITVNPPHVLNADEYRFMHGILVNIGIPETQIPEHISRQHLSGYFCCNTYSWSRLN